MDKQVKKERERIIELINLWRDHQDMGTSISAGKLIDAINGQDECHRKWLEDSRPARVIAIDDETTNREYSSYHSKRIRASRGHSPSRMG